MKGQKDVWLVASTHVGWWWQCGRWTQTPDTTKAYSNFAHPKTKVGAWRIAKKCPVRAEIICRKPSCRKWPDGYESRWWLGY